jgi:NAD(P)-dependent dehydrogenase (short-subunit alcohol dehydrogenase family)
VIGEVPDVTAALVAALTAEGYRVRMILPGQGIRRLQADHYAADLSSPESVRDLHQLLNGRTGDHVGGIINCLGLCPEFGTTGSEDGEAPVSVAEWTFNIVKEFAGDLQAGAQTGGGWFVNLTALGGQFGLDNGAVHGIAGAGTLGITKTLRQEYPRWRVQNIDVDPHMPADMLVARLIQELVVDDELLEVGLTRQGRWCPALRPSPAARDLPRMAIEDNAVILVTGGASGVTAEVTRALASSARIQLIVVGRSPLPEPESPRTIDLNRVALRKIFLDESRARGEKILPAAIERSVNRILKERQSRDNLEAFAAAGARVEYHSLDVRDSEPFGQLIDGLYDRFGRIDGVVHGAGIIEDKRLADKTLASFAAVFRTKVQGALTLARKLRPESLKFLVFFGSVAGRFGNLGQVDYSAANEVLNKLADLLNQRWPGKVVCINWGPWDGGMVSDDLRRMYTTAGVELIRVEQGVASFLSEIASTDRPNGEVVIARSVEQMVQSSRRARPATEQRGAMPRNHMEQSERSTRHVV